MQDKRSKKELTRLILTALILGGGCLYGPVAEADDPVPAASITDDGTTTVTTNNITSDSSNGIMIANWDGTNKIFTFKLQNASNLENFNNSSLLGLRTDSGDIEGFTVNHLGGVVRDVWGAHSTGSGNVSNNHVLINGGSFGSNVVSEVGGGLTYSGSATGNEVKITSGTNIRNVYGGYSNVGSATGNSVIINGTVTIDGDVVGGQAGTGSSAYVGGNSVTLGGTATIEGSIIGGLKGTTPTRSDNGGDNVLYLAGDAQGNTATNTGGSSGKVQGFEKFVIKDDFTFKTGDPILSAGSIDDNNVILDLSGANALKSEKLKAGTMTLFSIIGNGSSMSSAMKLKIGTAVTMLTKDATQVASYSAEGYTDPTSKVYLTHDVLHTIKYVGQNEYNYNGVEYNIKNTLKTVNLSNWNGTTSAVPTGWTKGTSAVTVSGTISDAAKTAVGAGNSKAILTADAGVFAGANIASAIAYGDKGDFSDAIETTGVTLVGDNMSGVKVEADGTKANAKLTYYGETKEVKTVNLGNMTWGTTASPTGYKFIGGSSGTGINASGLTFGTVNTALATNASMTLLANATGLTTANVVTGGTGKTVAIDYTDAKGIQYGATATGNVTAAANAVKYTVSGVALNSIDLSGWNGVTSALPTGWTGTGIQVSGNFAKPELAAGASQVILSADSDLFNNAVIDGAIKYKNSAAFTDDTENGITFVGNEAKGVKATDSGKKLTYFATKNDVNAITLGTVNWGTGREATGAYDFAGVTGINAENLTFTFSDGQEAGLSGTSSMTLLKNANNLAADKPVTYKDSAAKHTQTVSHTAGGAELTGTLTGTVATTAGQVNYQAESMTLDSVNLAGWNGTESAVPTGWTKNAAGVAVYTENMSEPEQTAGTVKTILTAGANYFADATISGKNLYQSYEFNSDEAAGVSFTGAQFKGVKANADNSALVYDKGKKKVTQVSLGEVNWGTARTASADYDFSGTSIDASGLTFTGTANAPDASMTLLSGATGLASPTITQPGNAVVNVAFTDAAGITYEGVSNAGNVSIAGTDVKYTITGGTLQKVNLNGWNGTTNPAVPTGWSAPTGGSSSGIPVDTGNFATPASVPAGGSVDIFTTDTEGFFGEVTGDKAYKDNVPVDNDEAGGVSLSGTKSGGIKTTENGKKLTYFGESMKPTAITPEVINWNPAAPARTMGAGYDFGGVDTVDVSQLNFNMTADEQNTVKKGDTMTILQNATGLTAKPDQTHKQEVGHTEDSGAVLKGSLNGTVSTTAGTMTYTVNSKTLDNVVLSGWDGTTATAVNASWEQNSGGVKVDTEGMTKPENMPVSTFREILTADTPLFAQTEVTGAHRYKEQEFNQDKSAGVNISGIQSGGVKANEDGKKLLYYAETMDAKAITLEDMDWGQERTMGTGYDFAHVETIDAGSLKLNVTNEEAGTLAKGQQITLLSGATNLAAGKEVTNANRTQEVGYNEGNGVGLTGTLTGTVSTDTGAINYTVDSMALDSVNLSGWDGSKPVSTVPTSWTKNAGGINVDTENMTVPVQAAGTEQTILTTGTADYFDNVTISETNRYKAYAFAHDETAGVSFTGAQSKGVKANADKSALVYATGKMDVSQISLDEVAWNTPRAVSADYDFAHVETIDAGSLKLNVTNEEAGTLAKGQQITLLSGATNLAAGKDVTNANRTQEVGYNEGNGVGLTGTLTGTVSTDTGAINYMVDSMALDSVNLSTWNGQESAVPAGWTNSAAMSVTGSGFTAPQLGLGTSVNILTTTQDGFFAGANIADELKHQEHPYTQAASNVTLSGNLSQGVAASADGKNLVYRVDDAKIDTITLGAMNYENGAVLIDGSSAAYDYSRVKALNTADFAMSISADQKKAVKTGDSMTLVKGNSTLGDIAAQNMENSSYAYTANPGLNVEATITGSLSATGGNVVYTINENKATNLTFGQVTWADTYNRPDNEALYSTAVVDAAQISFSGIENLTAGTKMLLVDNFGTGVQKVESGIFTLGGATGKGHAYWENGQLWYMVDRGNNETTAAADAVDKSEVFTAGSEQGSVIGGQAAGTGTANGNQAEVKGSNIQIKADGTGGDVIGGMSEDGTTEKNNAHITDSTVAGHIYGGKSDTGSAQNNTATVSGTKAGGHIHGGYSLTGETADNNVAVANSEVAGSVFGGKTHGSSAAKGNKAEVSDNSTIKGDVTGGQSENGAASANTASLTGSHVDGNVYGGKSDTAAVTQNTAQVSSGSVDGNVYGGKTDGAEPADTNTVNLTDGAVVSGGVYGGYSENGTASDNVVTINKATINDYLYGGKSKNKSANDKVYFHDGTVLGIIGGGCEVSTDNSVSLTEGTVSEHVIGGFADKTATGNTVTITGGTVTGSVIGGYGADTADGNSIYLGGGTVKGNTLTSAALGGITITGGVYGGYTSGTGTTQNNSVYLDKTADVSATGLYGGNKDATGNNLYVGMLLADGTSSAWTGGSQSTQNITNFENINFTAVPWSTTQAALTITDGTNSDLSMTNVSAAQVTFTGVKSLNTNDTMTLLDQSKVAADKQATKVTANSKFTVGNAVEGTGILSRDAKGNVLYKVESVKASEQTHNTVMGAAAAMTALSAGNDFIGAATEGLSLKENIGDDGVGCYAKIGGSHMKQETGSHVNVNTWNAILALGHKNVQKKSTVEYGAFFEYGKGNYATSNNGLRGDGSVDYTGGGLLGKWKKDNGFYVEGSFRAGRVHDDARNLLRDNVRSYSYSTSANYMGFHIGVGKQIAVANGNVVDVYGKYIYNRKNGVDFTVNGDDYKLDDVTSQIFRIGARYTMKREKWNFYGDAAYEHELDGKASGRVNGAGIRGVDTSGGSFRLELGAELRPDNKTPWSLNLNVTGYAGKKQGVQGGISLKYMF